MNVYIACPWKHKQTAKEVKAQLVEAGFKVVSRWIDFEADPTITYDYPDQIMEQEAAKDMYDLEKMHVMLYLNLEKSEGKATELGIALADSVPIYVVGGKQNNVFLHLDPKEWGITHINSVEDFIATAR